MYQIAAARSAARAARHAGPITFCARYRFASPDLAYRNLAGQARRKWVISLGAHAQEIIRSNRSGVGVGAVSAL
jgi:hypothetical protein